MTVDRAAVAGWLRQTSTIIGISTIVGLIAACLAGQMTWEEAVPGMLGAVAAILLPGGPPPAGTGGHAR